MIHPKKVLQLIAAGEQENSEDVASAVKVSIVPFPPNSGEFDGFFTISLEPAIPSEVLVAPQIIIQYEGQEPFEEFTAWFANGATEGQPGVGFGPYLLYCGADALEKNREGIAINVTILVVVNDAPMPYIMNQKFTENLWPKSS